LWLKPFSWREDGNLAAIHSQETMFITTVILQTKEIHYKNPTFGDSFVKTSAVVILICLEAKNTVENVVEFPRI